MENQATPYSNKEILIVEDDQSQQQTLSAILEDEGFKSYCCSDGYTAVEISKEKNFSVAILDLRLPDMDGIQVLQKLKSHSHQIKVIIHTGYATVETAINAVNQGAFAYLKKMGDIQELIAHVKNAYLTFWNESLQAVVQIRNLELEKTNQILKKEISDRQKVEMDLKKYHLELEQRVDDRTWELTQVNQKLKHEIDERTHYEKLLLINQKQLRKLSSQMILNQEQERRSIATDLHDSVAQTLALLKMKIAMIRANTTNKQDVESLAEVHSMIEKTIEETRSLTFQLSPPILYELGLMAAIEWLAEDIEQQFGINVKFNEDKSIINVDESISILLFRATRELMLNIVKHAQALNAFITAVNEHGKIFITVEDDGVGYNPVEIVTKTSKNSGYGLFSIRERLEELGGALNIESAREKGSKFTISLPY